LLKIQTLTPKLANSIIEGNSFMYLIPRIRAVSDDKRLTQSQIVAFLTKNVLSPLTRRAVVDAFSEAGLLSDGNIKAAAAKVDGDGRYPITAIDAALAKCASLKNYERIMIKNMLARSRLLQ
jgi:hypothetical protein